MQTRPRANAAAPPAEDDQVGGFACRQARHRSPEQPAGLVVTVAIACSNVQSVANSRFRTPDFQSLVRAGQIGCPRHDDLARGIDGPLAVSPRWQARRAGWHR